MSSTTTRARKLRQLQTDAEVRLWRYLRSRQVGGHKFRRQRPIGPYIADFICLECDLVIEIDGGQHAESRRYDDKRTRFIEVRGFKVLRFWNDEMLQRTEAVLTVIYEALSTAAPHPHPNPLPKGERE